MSDVTGDAEDASDVLLDCQEDLALWGLFRNMLHFSDAPAHLVSAFFGLELKYRAREGIHPWAKVDDMEGVKP